MESEFYEKAINYWAQIPPTVDGVLGGFDFISDVDIKGSKWFLEELFSEKSKLERKPPGKCRALDCGAGIGRVTKYLLSDYFEKVDLVEQNAAFLEKANDFVGIPDKIGTMYPVGLQNFVPEKKYDVIWSQWVLGHLVDDHLIDFLKKCRDSLDVDGLIIVKENVTSSNKLEKDETDSSVTRPFKHLTSIFKQAKLKTVKQSKQDNFPKGIYPVYMFALRPNDRTKKVNSIEKESKSTNEKSNKSDADGKVCSVQLESENIVDAVKNMKI